MLCSYELPSRRNKMSELRWFSSIGLEPVTLRRCALFFSFLLRLADGGLHGRDTSEVKVTFTGKSYPLRKMLVRLTSILK